MALGLTLVRSPSATLRRRRRGEIWPLQRIAAGEDHQRRAEFTYLIEEAVPFIGREFRPLPSRRRTGPAMHTGQVASLRGLPDYDEWRLIEVHFAPIHALT